MDEIEELIKSGWTVKIEPEPQRAGFAVLRLGRSVLGEVMWCATYRGPRLQHLVGAAHAGALSGDYGV